MYALYANAFKKGNGGLFSLFAFISSFMHFSRYLACGRGQKGAATRRQVKAPNHLEEGALEFEWDNGDCSGGYLCPSPLPFRPILDSIILAALRPLTLLASLSLLSKLLSWLWLGVLRLARNALMCQYLLDLSEI
jgi:hypothetical protein